MYRLSLTLSLIISAILSANAISFKFAPNSVPAGAPAQKMELNVSTMLSEIQRAAKLGIAPSLGNTGMEDGAKARLLAQWDMLPFTPDDDVIVAKCLTDHQGYQIRGIMITLMPRDNTYEGMIERELTISLNRNGVITGVRPALENQEDVSKIMSEGIDVDDLAQRHEILKWVEDFRNYYNERNINSMQQIFSDDALIITGSVVQSVSSETGQIINNVKYDVKSKAEYIDRLKKVFDPKYNKYINVKFDRIEIVKHRAKPNIYGVTLHQQWKSTSYSDDGWLFLVWDFNVPERPQIQVRTWQPEQIKEEFGLMTLDDIKIY